MRYVPARAQRYRRTRAGIPAPADGDVCEHGRKDPEIKAVNQQFANMYCKYVTSPTR